VSAPQELGAQGAESRSSRDLLTEALKRGVAQTLVAQPTGLAEQDPDYRIYPTRHTNPTVWTMVFHLN